MGRQDSLFRTDAVRVGFLVQFLIAGLTGIMLSIAPFNWQLHNSYFVIAHFHYVIVGAILFMVSFRHLLLVSEGDGPNARRSARQVAFLAFCHRLPRLTFDVMHVPGLLGMPRSIYTYEADRGWTTLNQIVSVGAAIQAIAIAIFVSNMIRSCLKGTIAGPDPWDAWTLEWTTSSPPPAYNFAIEPVVHSRRPLWDLKHPNDPDEIVEEMIHGGGMSPS